MSISPASPRKRAPIGIRGTVQGGNTHNFTWQYAYNIPELRDWVIAQTM